MAKAEEQDSSSIARETKTDIEKRNVSENPVKNGATRCSCPFSDFIHSDINALANEDFLLFPHSTPLSSNRRRYGHFPNFLFSNRP